MAYCCPRTCSRLATAAAFISIGIVQFISGMLLLRSRFVYLLSGPNFWTAAANISVGGLLGISATIWKTTNRKSVKHVSRRNVLAALVSSTIILNATTTAILIVGEGNILLSIHLESNNTFNSTLLATEILGYAYAASLCSPIVAVVVAIAFLLGLCFQVKSHKSKKLDIQSAVRDDTPDIYSWVYTPKLPKPDLDVLRIAVSSSGSGTSSSDSDSTSSGEVPVLLRSHTPQCTVDRPSSMRDKVSYLRETLYDPVEKITRKSSLRSSCSRSNKVFFTDDFILDKRTGLSVPMSHDKILYSSLSKGVDAMPASATHKAHKDRLLTKKRSRVRPKILFKEYPSGEMLGHSDNEVFVSISSKDSGAIPKRDTRFKKSSISDSFPRIHNSSNFSSARKKSKEFPILHSEALRSSDIVDVPQYHHRSLRRTSTTDDSKFIEAIASPEGSEICLDSVFVTREIHNNESQECLKNVSIGKDFATSDSACETLGDEITIPVKDSDFRAKLSAKLVRVPTPVVSNIQSNLKAPRRYSSSVTNGVHTKIDNKHYYPQSSFSSFRNEIKSKMKVDGILNELDATKYHRRHSSVLKSPMDSISELPTEEINEQLLTSTHTSGYISVLDESGNDSSELNTSKNSRKQSPSIAEDADTSNETENKKSDFSKKLKSSDLRSLAAPHRNKIQKAIENFASENPDITVEDLVSHLLQTV